MTASSVIAPNSIVDGYYAHAVHRSGERALIDHIDSYVFAELWSAACGLAERLQRSGIGPGAAVGVAMEGSAAYVAAVLGAMLTGAAAAPINVALTETELERYLELLEPTTIVADPYGLERLPAGWNQVEVDTAARGVRLADRLGASDRMNLPTALAALPPASPALLVPTGGTTGLPKAAVISHQATLLWALSMAGHGRAGSGVELFFLPFFHIGLLTGVLSTLHAGAPAIIQRRFDPAEACDLICRGATRIQVVPTHIRRMLAVPNFDEARQYVRQVRFGGMMSAPEFADELLEVFPNAQISTGYGATEFGPVTLVNHDDLVAGRRAGVGRPVPGAHVAIVSGAGESVAIGEAGHVVVRCPWQASGYVGRPEESAAAFTTAGVRLADWGAFDEHGWLTLLGRQSDMVITGGENVFPAEIEAVLLAHPDVVDVVVIGVPDATWGERVEAAVVARPGATVTVESLREFGRGHLASYKLPRSVRLLDRIPLTPNHKPDRRALQASERAHPEPVP
jgi:acyl-CoA synthetase (AMP-forming)/AMP-acid ligase II